MVEENEWSHHSPFREWQHAPDFHAAAQVSAPLLNYHLDQCAVLSHYVLSEWNTLYAA